MGTTISQEDLKSFMQILNERVVVNKPVTRDGVETEVNMFAGTGIKFMGHLLEKNPTHIAVLLGAEYFAAIEEVMEKLGVHFGMDTLGWEEPVRP